MKNRRHFRQFSSVCRYWHDALGARGPRGWEGRILSGWTIIRVHVKREYGVQNVLKRRTSGCTKRLALLFQNQGLVWETKNKKIYQKWSSSLLKGVKMLN